MADLVCLLIIAAEDTNLSHKIHVVLHDLNSLLRGAPCTILSPLTDPELDAGEALSCQRMLH